MELIALPVLSDNYIWLLRAGGRALVVDPGVAEAVQAAMQGLALECIFITHQHHDHIDGLPALAAQFQPPIYAPEHPAIRAKASTQVPAPVLQALGLTWQVIAAPGHTLNHLLYYCPSVPLATRALPVLFCGDTLFSAGCGRLFEGTPAQMLHSLGLINRLPADCLVCCTHEYTLTNLRFALSLEPDNADLLQYQARCMDLRERGLPTLPSTLQTERRINPFLRVYEADFAAAMAVHFGLDHQSDALAVFTALRRARNQFV